MSQHKVDMTQTIMVCFCNITVSLHADQQIHQRGNRCLGKWVTCGDVDLLNLCWNAMDGCLKQVFITKNDGCMPVIGNAVLLPQPGTDISCLDILCRGRDIGYGLLSGEVVVDVVIVIVQLVGEVVEILGNVVTCLELFEVIVVVVPIETGFTLLLHPTEERLLNLLEHVEANKEIGIVFEINIFAFSYFTVECPFIG